MTLGILTAIHAILLHDLSMPPEPRVASFHSLSIYTLARKGDADVVFVHKKKKKKNPSGIGLPRKGNVFHEELYRKPTTIFYLFYFFLLFFYHLVLLVKNKLLTDFTIYDHAFFFYSYMNKKN